MTYPIEPYAELVRHYRQRWESYGHRPEDALVGAGTAGFHVAATSQQAIAEYRPAFETRLAFQRRAGLPVVFESIEDFVERSSALIGSPQQVIDKVSRYHEQLGHEVIHLSAEADGVTVGAEASQPGAVPIRRRPRTSGSDAEQAAGRRSRIGKRLYGARFRARHPNR